MQAKRVEHFPIQEPDPGPSWLKQHWQKLIAGLLWLSLLGGYQFYSWSQELSPLEAVRQLIDLMGSSFYGPLLYILVYALRPLLFFSALLLTLAGGVLFGPVWGIVYTVIAANISATVAYLVGRYFGQGLFKEDATSDSYVQRYAQRMRHNSFETILIMRFIFLPYDLVNYLAGFLRIAWAPFILATALGSIPGTVSFVLFAASIEGELGAGMPSLNPWTLGISVLLFVGSLALSRYFKGRERGAARGE